MLTVIHGDDTAKSRTFYVEERKKYAEKTILDGEKLNLTDLLQATTSAGLFGSDKALFVEDLISKHKASKELDALTRALTGTEMPIFLWESKQLTPGQLKPFGKATIKIFSIPKTVFAFLDAIAPGNSTKAIQLFHELLATQDANFVLFMLERQIRMLLGVDSDIAEVKRLAPWQKSKLQKQAKAFSEEVLISLHEKLFAIELAQKTGKLATSLETAIDFFLAEI